MSDNVWSETLRCTKPPPGWACSRGEGHPGPCAATPVSVGRMIVGAVCVYENVQGQILGVRDHKGRGVILPGGKVEPDETYRQAAIRELHEETGMVAIDTTLVYQGISSPECESYTYAFRVDKFDRLPPLGTDLGSGEVKLFPKAEFLQSKYKAFYELLFEVMDR